MRTVGLRQPIVVFALAIIGFGGLLGPALLVFRGERGQAAFGDSQTVGVNRLSSATVDVEIGSRSVSLSSVDLAPGDRVVGSIEVRNEGTLPLRYALVDESATGPLLPWLTWELWDAPTPSRCGTSPTSVNGLVDGLVLGPRTGSGTSPRPGRCRHRIRRG